MVGPLQYYLERVLRDRGMSHWAPEADSFAEVFQGQHD